MDVNELCAAQLAICWMYCKRAFSAELAKPIRKSICEALQSLGLKAIDAELTTALGKRVCFVRAVHAHSLAVVILGSECPSRILTAVQGIRTDINYAELHTEWLREDSLSCPKSEIKIVGSLG